MLDFETVDRAFSTYQKAYDYLYKSYSTRAHYVEHPELLKKSIDSYIQEVKFDVD